MDEIGLEPIQTGLQYLGVEINEYNENAFKLLLFGAIDRSYHPCKFDYIIVLIDKTPSLYQLELSIHISMYNNA